MNDKPICEALIFSVVILSGVKDLKTLTLRNRSRLRDLKVRKTVVKRSLDKLGMTY